MYSSGDLLRRARIASGLSQQELASRLGISQSVISAYESGRRNPALPTLERLIGATEHSLSLSVTRNTRRGPLMARVDSHREEIVALMAEYGATNPRLFGSVARGTETAESDIDIAVDLAPGTGLFALGALRSRVESLLGARVDIVPAGDLKADVRVNFAVDSVSL